jgi:hypothetical protein
LTIGGYATLNHPGREPSFRSKVENGALLPKLQIHLFKGFFTDKSINITGGIVWTDFCENITYGNVTTREGVVISYIGRKLVYVIFSA